MADYTNIWEFEGFLIVFIKGDKIVFKSDLDKYQKIFYNFKKSYFNEFLKIF